MMPSVLVTLIEALNAFTPVGSTAIAYQQVVPGGTFTHTLRLNDPVQHEDLRNIIQRMECQVIISALPDEALSETQENLSELYHHYMTPYVTEQLRPIGSPSFVAHVGTTLTRPDLIVEE